MGLIKWRAQEWLFLEELAASKDGMELLRRDAHNWWKDAVCWFVANYKEKFDYCFNAETAEEFALRRKLRPRTTQGLYGAETEDDWKARIGGLNKVCVHLDFDVPFSQSAKRIGSYLKNKSPNRKRNISKKSRESEPASSIVDMMSKSSTPPRAPVTNGFQLFFTSDHPSRPQTAGLRGGRCDVAAFSAECSQVYKSLPDRETFELQARKLNAERHATTESTSPDRNA